MNQFLIETDDNKNDDSILINKDNNFSPTIIENSNNILLI